ncbi:diaminopimelate epimerase [Flammeovirgaceae bacterium 311]|nr:diaminopimelate epimerase [Flammeovirgaceae bacterium 311]
MSKLQFYKYHGTGNDFIMIDNRQEVFDKENLALVRQLCHRRYGIGADGLILIENSPETDFEMIYFNSDGSKSFCGNGSRCAVYFARFLGIVNDNAEFKAIDGFHEAYMLNDQVYLRMRNVDRVEQFEEDMFINTGSPHYIRFVKELADMNVVDEGKKIRYSELYKAEGTNVNFAEPTHEGKLYVRTYERGVEDETLSCGTGVTAVALASTYLGYASPVKLVTPGGQLQVAFKTKGNDQFTDIYLSGPVTPVYVGEISI